MKRMISDTSKLEQLAKKTTINKDGSVSIEGVGGGSKLYQHNIVIIGGVDTSKHVRVALTIINNSNIGFVNATDIHNWLKDNGLTTARHALMCNGFVQNSSGSSGQVHSVYQGDSALVFNLVGTGLSQNQTTIPINAFGSTINDTTIEL